MRISVRKTKADRFFPNSLSFVEYFILLIQETEKFEVVLKDFAEFRGNGTLRLSILSALKIMSQLPYAWAKVSKVYCETDVARIQRSILFSCKPRN